MNIRLRLMKYRNILFAIIITVNLSFGQGLVINEFMADNQSAFMDQDGEFDDWIELYNNTGQTIGLEGYFLSDDSLNITRWTFPDTIIGAGSYLIIWADDEVQAGLHANFKISASGEMLVLSSPDTSMIDEVVFSESNTDVSIGRFPNGTGDFRDLVPTPGEQNIDEEPVIIPDYGELIFSETVINKFEMNFYVEDWQDSLEYYYEVLDEQYLPAQVVYNDTTVFDSVGVRYKGNSSYMFAGNSPKKPFKFKFDKFIDEQTFFGFKRLNFSNCAKDPSFMRETISYYILRQYMAAPRTAYANLLAEGEEIGFYVQVEQVDKEFLDDNFPDDNGNLYKAQDGGATLEYRGDDKSDYESEYKLDTNEELDDWSDLITMIDNLNNTPPEQFVDVMQGILNFDSCIRLLAFNMVMSNFDSYTGSGRNFYLYNDPETGQMVIIPWDLNESFGAFTFSWDVISQDIITTSNLDHRPLFARILENDSLNHVYTGCIEELINGPASYDSVTALTEIIAPVIDASVQADNNKLYSYQSFLSNIEHEVSLGLPGTVPGIKSFSQIRNECIVRQLSSMPVHPGDCDNNGVVNEYDVLPVGIYFLEDGAARENGSLSWMPQLADVWDDSSAAYADANGDGVVDETDVIAIGVNWGNTHNYLFSAPEIFPAGGEIINEHRDDLLTIYNSLSGNNEAVNSIKQYLESLLDLTATSPQYFSLQQNYPNPFNSETIISFDLPENQTVTLTVYNLLGQIAAVPISEAFFTAGTHTVGFDASQLASGIYIYQIQTERWDHKRKMVLIK